MTRLEGGLGGSDPLSLVTAEHQVNHIQESRMRAIDAYKRNLLLPDVALADRRVPYTPVVKGEDGLEITQERRAQIMAEAGVRPMYEIGEDGKPCPTGEVYSGMFEGVNPERLGESAEANRHEMMIVLPRVLEDEDVVQAAEGLAGHALTFNELRDRERCGAAGGQCVYTTGAGAISDYDGMVAAVLTACRRMREAAEDDELQLYALMAPETREAVARLLERCGRPASRRLCGMEIRVSRHADVGIRVNVSGMERPDTPYARLFLGAEAYELPEEELAGPHAHDISLVTDGGEPRLSVAEVPTLPPSIGIAAARIPFT